MAVFGIPTVREDDALRAVRAAVEMRTALAELNEQLERRWGVRLQTRTGVNTGEVIAGDPVARRGLRQRGRRQRRRPARAGRAARRDPHRRAHARARPPGRSPWSRSPPLELKGKSEPVPRLPAGRGRAMPAGRRAAADLAAGRPRARAERCSRRPSTATSPTRRASWSRSSAPPGSASRGSPTTSRHRSRGEATVVAGRCLSYGEGLTFWPLREVVEALAGSADDEQLRGGAGRDRAPAGGRRRHGDRSSSAWPARSGWSDAAAYPAETFWAVRKLLEAAARRAAARGPLRGHPLGGAHLPRPDRAPRRRRSRTFRS